MICHRSQAFGVKYRRRGGGADCLQLQIEFGLQRMSARYVEYYELIYDRLFGSLVLLKTVLAVARVETLD